MIVGCRHGEDPTRPQPCPPMCPAQQWPQYMFRLSWWRDRWVLRRQYRDVLDQQEASDE